MSKYRKVDVKIWNDAKFVALSERGKLVFLFLMTHPNLTIVGAMRATAPGLAAEIGIPLEAFREAFREALSKGMAKVDKSAALIWLPNFLKYNKPESPNVVKAWPDAFDMLPECELKSQVFQHVKGFAEGMTEGFRKPSGKSSRKAYRKPSRRLRLIRSRSRSRNRSRKKRLLSLSGGSHLLVPKNSRIFGIHFADPCPRSGSSPNPGGGRSKFGSTRG